MNSNGNATKTFRSELEAGIGLLKCQKCGCMANTLKSLATALPAIDRDEASELNAQVTEWLRQMRPVQYACLGCEHCYPAVGQNALTGAFPELEQLPDTSCEFQVHEAKWPAVTGEYLVLDRSAAVAVSTLASVELASELAGRQPKGLAIVGKTETENIGIDKIVKNIVSNRSLRYLVVAGTDPQGHAPGRTLLALAQNGVDERGRVIGSPGKRPILRNVTLDEIQAFRDQVQVIDRIGCTNVSEINAQVEELAGRVEPASLCSCSECDSSSTVTISAAPKLVAQELGDIVKMDRAGYFVILPVKEGGLIAVEHYSYDDTLLRVIEGETARAIYHNIIKNGWITELTHAAYLGKELAKAELSLQEGTKYVQDGA